MRAPLEIVATDGSRRHAVCTWSEVLDALEIYRLCRLELEEVTYDGRAVAIDPTTYRVQAIEARRPPSRPG